MARTPARFFGPDHLSSVPAALYSSPESTISTVRHLHFTNPTAQPVLLTLSIGADGDGTRIFDRIALPPNSVHDHFVYYPLAEDEVIEGFANIADVIVLVISGDHQPDGVG